MSVKLGTARYYGRKIKVDDDYYYLREADRSFWLSD